VGTRSRDDRTVGARSQDFLAFQHLHVEGRDQPKSARPLARSGRASAVAARSSASLRQSCSAGGAGACVARGCGP
jgi:hypothetical protein